MFLTYTYKNFNFSFLAIVLILLTVISTAETANAETFTVTRTDDRNGICNSGVDCSLREAINAANAATTDDLVNFDSAAFASTQNISITQGLSIFDNGKLTVAGPGTNLLIISGNNQSVVFYVAPQVSATVGSLTVTNGYGGFDNYGTLTLNDLSVSNNNTTRSGFPNSGLGGGIFNQRFAKITINNSTISNNVANSRGGGILNREGTVDINNSSIVGNYSLNGSGIRNDQGTLTINNSIISDNMQSSSIFNNGGTLTIIGSTINNNASGILSINLSTVNIIASTISRNTNIGISNLGSSTMNLVNLTVSNNTSSPENSHSGKGGGIYNEWTMNITNSTITGNSAVDGGGIFTYSARVNICNSVIGNNTATNSAPDYFGTLASQGYNLIENTSGTTIIGTTAGNILGQDPLLDPVLRNNGGPTLTHALLTGSPAINTGDNTNAPATDQRGFARISGGIIDIGAFEASAPKARRKIRFF